MGAKSLAACLALCLAVLAAACRPETAPAPPAPATFDAARKIASRLTYVGARYPAAVQGGKVAEAAEYRQQVALLEQAEAAAAELPDDGRRADISRRLDAVAGAVRRRAAAAEVTGPAKELAAAALERYRVALAPLATPDRERARSLFRDTCAKCHGERGAGDGPQALELAIKPRSLTAPEVMEEMSPVRVFNTLTDGVGDASMPAFDLLAARDRWALASFVMTLRFAGPDGGDEGELPPGAAPPSRAALASSTDRELRQALGGPGLAWARTHLAFAPPSGPLAPAYTGLADAVAAQGEGKRPAAEDHLDAAISEVLAPLRAGLLLGEWRRAWRLEDELYQLRAEIPEGAATSVTQRALAAAGELDKAEATLAGVRPMAMAGVAALASLGWIVVLLLTGAVAARANGMQRVGRAIHIGWILAVVAGAGTLLASKGGVDLAAASQRHQVVAVLKFAGAAAALVAAVAILRRLAAPIPRPDLDPERTPWWLATAAFAISYGGTTEAAHQLARIAETTGSSRPALLAAAALAAGGLAAALRIAAELRRRTGTASLLGVSALLAVLCAVALVGHGTHALLDGGTLTASRALSYRFDPLGIYPYGATAVAQLAVASLAAAAAVVAIATRRRAVTDRRG